MSEEWDTRHTVFSTALSHTQAQDCSHDLVFTQGSTALQESGQRLTPEEMDRVDMMPKFTLNNAHYFCETADITRPFPSTHSVDDPSWEFVWNRWLAASLRFIGLSSHCPHLLQACHCATKKLLCPHTLLRLACCPATESEGVMATGTGCR